MKTPSLDPSGQNQTRYSQFVAVVFGPHGLNLLLSRKRLDGMVGDWGSADRAEASNL